MTAKSPAISIFGFLSNIGALRLPADIRPLPPSYLVLTQRCGSITCQVMKAGPMEPSHFEVTWVLTFMEFYLQYWEHYGVELSYGLILTVMLWRENKEMVTI